MPIEGEFELSVFNAGVSVIFDCSTDPAHARPYLIAPTEGVESEVDLQKGSAVIGQVNLRVLDKRTVATDQRMGWLTALLADAGGENAVNGRGARLRRYSSGTWVLVVNGVLGGVKLNDPPTSYTLSIRDENERARKTRAFVSANTSTVLPRGVWGGYGQMPGGRWLQPPVTPLRAAFKRESSTRGYAQLDDGNDSATLHRVALTDAVRSVTALEWSSDGKSRIARDVTILWRPLSGGAWKELVDMQLPAPFPGFSVLATDLFRTDDTTRFGGARDVPVIRRVTLTATGTGATPAIPTDGQRIELVIRYRGEPSEQYPLHLDGRTFGQVLADLYDGVYSPAGTIPVRYDSAAVLALTQPLRARITKPVDDLRDWVEKHIYQPLGAAPSLDASGLVSPVRYALPDPSVTVPAITDAEAAPAGSWEHSASGAINTVRVTYQREYRVDSKDDPTGSKSAGDGITSRDVEVVRTHPASVAIHGEQALEMKPVTLTAIGTEDGKPASGDVTSEVGHQLATARGIQAIDRFVHGGQVFGLKVRSGTAPRVGDWRVVQVAHYPDYQAKRRGSDRLAQIVAVRPLQGTWYDLRLVDAGAANQPVGQPTLGTVTADSDGVVSVPVSAVPAGAEARVDFAVSPTLPAADSGLWTFLGRTGAPVTLTTPPQPAGTQAWVRARGEAPGRRPSVWSAPVSVVTPSTARILSAGAVVDEVTGDVVVTWEANASATGVRTYVTVGTRSYTVDASAALGTARVASAMRPGETAAVEVEPWTGWTGSAVSGTAGARVARDAVLDADATTTAVTLEEYQETPASKTYRIRAGAGVAEVWGAVQTYPVINGPADPRAIVRSAAIPLSMMPGAALQADGSWLLTVSKPNEGQASYGHVYGTWWLGNVQEYGAKEWFKVDGIAAPVDARVVVVESADGTTATMTVTLDDPRGVASFVRFYRTELGVRTGPFAATTNPSALVWTYTLPLHPLHNVIVQPGIVRNDGQAEILLGAETLDTDKVPEIEDVRQQRSADVETVLVDGDTDVASLWRRTDDGAGNLGPETAIAARSGQTPRFGEFTLTATLVMQRFRLYGKNGAGVVGPYRDVRIDPYIAPGAASAPPSLDVRAQAGDTSYVVTWSGDGVQVSVNGGAYQQAAPSPATVARPAAGATPLELTYRATKNGLFTTTGVTILPIGVVAPSLDLSCNPGAGTNTEQPFAPAATNLATGAALPVTVRLTGCSGFNNGVTLPADTTQTVNGPIVVTRPVFGAGDGSARFTAESGGAKEVTEYPIRPQLRDTQYAQCVAQTISTTATQYVVEVTGGTAVQLIAITGSATLAAGGYQTVAPGSQWTFNRGAPLGGSGQAKFRATAPGMVDDPALVEIVEQGRDTVAVALRATVLTSTATQVVARLRMIDPHPPAAANQGILEWAGVVGVISSASATVSPTADFATTPFVDVTIQRPAFGAGTGQVVFTARDAAGARVPAADAVDVPEVAQLGGAVREQPSEAGLLGTLTLEPVAGAVFDQVRFRTKSGTAAWSAWVVDGAAPYSASVSLVEKHVSMIAYEVSNGGVVIQENVVSFDVASIADVDLDTASDGVNATITARFDTDTAIAGDSGRYNVDGGGWTALAVDATRHVTFVVAQGVAVRVVRVQGRNDVGDWGPEAQARVPIAPPSASPSPPPSIIEAYVRRTSDGACVNPGNPSNPGGVSTPMQVTLTYSTGGALNGHSIHLELSKDGGAWTDQLGALAAGGALTQTYSPSARVNSPPGIDVHREYRLAVRNGTALVATMPAGAMDDYDYNCT